MMSEVSRHIAKVIEEMRGTLSIETTKTGLVLKKYKRKKRKYVPASQQER